jgi:nucleoside-diphosphate-sugar epimerase
MMSVLVTGGTGFVGINIASVLLARGDAVVLFDRSAVPEIAHRHLTSLPGQLRVVIGDVCDRKAVIAAMEENKVTKAVHGAAITAGLDREKRDARTIAMVNTIGTIEVLEAALACHLTRVVQLGTGSVFGRPSQGLDLLDEDENPTPESLYGITKYAAECIARRYRATRNLDVAVGRLGVVFGQWEYDTGVRDTLSIPLQLLKAATAGEVARFMPTVPDDWIYAADVASAVAALLDAPDLREPVYHLATGRRWSVPSWCDRLQSAFPGFTYEVTADASRVTIGASAPSPRPPFSVERIRRATAFTAAYDEASAFDDYIEWHRATVNQGF